MLTDSKDRRVWWLSRKHALQKAALVVLYVFGVMGQNILGIPPFSGVNVGCSGTDPFFSIFFGVIVGLLCLGSQIAPTIIRLFFLA